ncbi:hypothetical protein EUTSA_v10000490mg [Eutrema salsugineum]|uniref:F-box domain-containing protein n=1 Tax=Eutrema salsugineum TaxID=72664 RepID=V4LUW7_EUTSA|nr:hypothetical protein EUTSA_v10000490mg [Eutrema salsugineum]
MMSAAEEQSRRKKRSLASSSYGFSSLPDELVLDCFARVSRMDHAALSLTSKSYRSLVISPELYETRSQMGFMEGCIYVCLDTLLRSNPRWFILWRRKQKTTDSMLTSRVSFLDCRTHTWSQVPSMGVARTEAKAGVLDGKIYVMGGCCCDDYEDPLNVAEVFNPKMQTRSRVLITEPVINNKVSVVVRPDSWFINFRSEEGKWNDLNIRDACVMDRLLYCCDYLGRIMWCDPWSGVRNGRMEWNKVYGLDDTLQLLGFFLSGSRSMCFDGEMSVVWHCYMLKRGYTNGFQDLLPGFKLSISGGKIVIFWERLVEENENPKSRQIWCAEITVERRKGGQIWGMVQWSNPVFTIDPSLFHFMSSVNVNV